jgi:RES domain-containing protein
LRPQRLDRVLTCYRVGDPEGAYPILDATGSTLFPGRWNEPDTPPIYASEHYATAILEKLAHASGLMPRNQHWIAITVPNGASFEVVTRDHLPGWDAAEPTVARAHGAKWARERRSLLLLVPSYVARLDRNVLINPNHPEFKLLSTTLPEPVWWDGRLF